MSTIINGSNGLINPAIEFPGGTPGGPPRFHPPLHPPVCGGEDNDGDDYGRCHKHKREDDDDDKCWNRFDNDGDDFVRRPGVYYKQDE